MPDLFTHYASARLPAAFLRDRRIAALVVIGTFLPDLAAKGLYWLTRSPEPWAVPTHSLPGLLVLSYLAALFLEERLRGRAFAALTAGAFLHVAVDILKGYLGVGAARLLFPFSLRGTELGLIKSEDVLWLLPIDALLVLAAWAIERRRRDVRP